MIRIRIEQILSESYQVTKNFVIERTPTEIVEDKGYSSYGGSPKREVCYHETFAPREVTETRETTRELLRQEITDDAKFDLVGVIAAINGMHKFQPTPYVTGTAGTVGMAAGKKA